MTTDKQQITVVNLAPIKKKRLSKHYVNNADFYDALVEFRAKTLEAETQGLEKPRIPEYIGKCIFLIATKLANMPNFCSYSYRDEMIADGIEDCILRIHSFNPDVSTNPFSYFTQTCYYAAVRRIKKEKKQKTVKSEIIKNSGILDNISEQQDSDDNQYGNDYLQFLQENLEQAPAPQDESNGPKIIYKRTTKAHQKRLKELEENALKTMDNEPTGFDESLVDFVEHEIEDSELEFTRSINTIIDEEDY